MGGGLEREMLLTDPTRIPSVEAISKLLAAFPIDVQTIYPRSFQPENGLLYGMVRTNREKKLLVIGEKERLLNDPFNGKLYESTPSLKVCDLTLNNVLPLMERFPFTKPVPILNFSSTIGTGDRLGLATPGHIRAVRKFNVRPVLAQQSIRENRQTGRTLKEVIADAAWSVFQENYRDGYGADGDHVKSLEEVKQALESGVSMITLDLSQKLNLDVLSSPEKVIERRFAEEIDPGEAEVLLHLFLDKEFTFKGPEGHLTLWFSEINVKRHVLLFYQTLDFLEETYLFVQRHTGRRPLVDFEISIDETPFPTSPETHLFLIIALNHRGVRIGSLAPRFIGEFEKGIDYKGEVSSFREQFYHHVLISQHYGNYKLSIHSGSDKFSIFPVIGQMSQGKFHLKTSGTSWLEAIRLISSKDPSLYREIHHRALSSFGEASKHYHVTTDPSSIPPLKDLTDGKLPTLLDQEKVRQLLHITYGSLLKSDLRERVFRTLIQYEEDYASLLERHIENHLVHLGIERRNRR